MEKTKDHWGFEAGYWTLLALVSYRFVELRLVFFREYPEVPIQKLLEGTAPAIWQTRALMPWLARSVFNFLPPSVFFQLAEGASVFIAVYFLRRFLANFVPSIRARSALSFALVPALLFHYVLPRYSPYYYPWDLPAVAFFSVGLDLLYRRSWRLFFPLVFVATLNRETTFFWPFLYLFTRTPDEMKDRKATALRTIALILCWVVPRAIVQWVYQDNAGSSLVGFVPNLENGPFLSEPSNYPYLLSLFGFVWIPCLFFGREIRNHFVRRMVWVFWPLLAVIFFSGVNVYELRSFGDLAPIFVAAFLVLVHQWIQEESPRLKS